MDPVGDQDEPDLVVRDGDVGMVILACARSAMRLANAMASGNPGKANSRCKAISRSDQPGMSFINSDAWTEPSGAWSRGTG